MNRLNRDEVMKTLKNYRSYRYAVKNCRSEPLGFGARITPFLKSDKVLTMNQWDYERYSVIISKIDGAISEVLSDDEHQVIKYKYLERNKMTLYEIGDKCNMSIDRVKYLHRTAINELTRALMFVEAPDIINLDPIMKDKKEGLPV